MCQGLGASSGAEVVILIAKVIDLCDFLLSIVVDNYIGFVP